MSKFDHKRIAYWSHLREIPNPTDRLIGTSRVLSSVANTYGGRPAEQPMFSDLPGYISREWITLEDE